MTFDVKQYGKWCRTFGIEVKKEREEIPEKDPEAEKRVKDAKEEFALHKLDWLKEASLKLGAKSKSEYGSERIKDNFADNNSYKVCYRFSVNLATSWEELGLSHFPTEYEAIKIASLADPYFIWLFQDERELEGFKSTFDNVADVWREE